MNPAPSVILFSVLSGMGFGLLSYLGMGVIQPVGWPAFFHWGLGYGLAVIGLLAATFHLGNPKRAWRAYSQWRTSWLSREAWGAVVCLLMLAPMALSDWLGLGWSRGFGVLGAALALFTVLTTAMIYTQIRAVPRWHMPLTPVMFLSFAIVGGAILSGQFEVARWGSLALTALLVAVWKRGDGQFARAGQTMQTATGLTGQITVFERGHTAGNYLLREMIYVVGRKHAQRLRLIALILLALPLFILSVAPNIFGIALAGIAHLIGALAARWLFFAEAEHVVGLYYGAR
jgi:DMSO reductase anchor subunit